MAGKTNTVSKKTVIAITLIIVLLFIASISVGIFLANKGSTEAADGNQVSGETQIAEENQPSESKEANTEDNNENVRENNTNNNVAENDTANNTVTENNMNNVNNENSANNTEITTDTNVNEVGETTVIRVEEKEKLISRDFWDWWTPSNVVAVNSAIANKIVPTTPDFTVEKFAKTGVGEDKLAYAGQNITYTIKVTNNGEQDLKNIEITDRIPEQTTFVSIDDTLDGETIEVDKIVIGVKWSVTVPAKEAVEVKFTVKVNESATETILNYAVANGKESNEIETTVIKPKEYDVKINVPGKDGIEMHDEIIVMVDGSYSTDDDWVTTRSVILEIGKTVLEGEGNTLLTVMTFGMGDNIVVQHVKSVSELDSKLTPLPGGLLYGRSSTNCEAGFTGIAEYIENHDATLNEVHVIYITDGEINTDETEYVFYNWTENTWIEGEPKTIAYSGLIGEVKSYDNKLTVLSEAFLSVFGNPEEEGVSTAAELLVNTITDEKAMDWATQVWDDVYEYSNLDPKKAYPVSDVERAFIKYDKEKKTYIQDLWYYSLIGRTYPEGWVRTPNAGIELAKNEKIKHLYMVDSNTETAWMSNMANSSDKISFYEAGSTEQLLKSIEGVLTDLSKTPYNDVVLTTYTSKWFNLDTNSISIIDNASGATIYTIKDGWLIEKDKRPTNQEMPIKIEAVSENEYDSEGNTSGEIYKITWYVKDGALLRSNSYCLKYSITEDYLENGFEYNNTKYPLKGETKVMYKNEKNESKEEKLA